MVPAIVPIIIYFAAGASILYVSGDKEPWHYVTTFLLWPIAIGYDILGTFLGWWQDHGYHYGGTEQLEDKE